MTAFKMPERRPGDTSINVRRLDNEYLRIWYDGDTEEPFVCAGSVVLSPYNAARLLGILAMFLGADLGRKLSKAIVLTTPGKPSSVSYKFPEPKTLGERLAQALFIARAPAKIGDFEKVEAEPGPIALDATASPSLQAAQSQQQQGQQAQSPPSEEDR